MDRSKTNIPGNIKGTHFFFFLSSFFFLSPMFHLQNRSYIGIYLVVG